MKVINHERTNYILKNHFASFTNIYKITKKNVFAVIKSFNIATGCEKAKLLSQLKFCVLYLQLKHTSQIERTTHAKSECGIFWVIEMDT